MRDADPPGTDAGSFQETPGRIDVALAIPVRRGKVLVACRQRGSHLAGLWEFPGGKIRAGEAPAEAAGRELEEETGLRVGNLEPLVVVVHDYTEMPLRFHVFLVREPEGEVRMDVPRAWAWKSLAELRELEMPSANRQMLKALGWRGV